MKNKSNKSMKILIIVLLLIIVGLIIFGCYGYKKLTNEYDKLNNEYSELKNSKIDTKENSEVITSNDFYSASNLVANKYLFKQDKTESSYENNGTVIKSIKIVDGKVKIKQLKSNSFEEAKSIEGTPKYVYATEYVETTDPYYVLTEEGDVYVNPNVFDNKKNDLVNGPFKKISNKKIVNIYSLNRSFDAPESNIFTSGIYAEDENGNLYEVTGNGMSNKTFKQTYPNLG